VAVCVLVMPMTMTRLAVSPLPADNDAAQSHLSHRRDVDTRVFRPPTAVPPAVAASTVGVCVPASAGLAARAIGKPELLTVAADEFAWPGRR
jgi:hypothetical protein